MKLSSRDISISAILLGTSAFLALNFFSAKYNPAEPGIASENSSTETIDNSEPQPSPDPEGNTDGDPEPQPSPDPEGNIEGNGFGVSEPTGGFSGTVPEYYRMSTDGAPGTGIAPSPGAGVSIPPTATGGKQGSALTFTCERRSRDFLPVTFVYDGGEKIPLIRWEFGISEGADHNSSVNARTIDRNLRCEQAAERMQYWSNRLGRVETHITTGRVGGSSVICVAVEGGYPCNRDSVLFR